MLTTVQLNSYYDWDPVPTDVEVTDADIKAKRVKPAADGKWLMRVTKKNETHTTVNLPEEELVTLLLQDAMRDKSAHTRAEALGHYLARHVMQHHAHRSWMTGFTVQDDGPDKVLFEKMLDIQVAAGNVEELDRERLLASYMSPLTAEEFSAYLCKHFGVAKGEN